MLRQLRGVGETVNDYVLWIIVASLISAWSLVLWSKRPRKTVGDMRDITMSPEARRLHVKRVCADYVCDGLLEAYLDGELSADEANAELAQLAKFYSHEELIPLINDKKNRIAKKRLKDARRRKELKGKTDPVPIPGPKPGQAEKPVVERKDDLGTELASILSS